MKNLFIAFAILLTASSTSHADFFIGETLEDAQSGSELTFQEGTSSTLGIWVLGDQGQNIRSVNFNLIATTAGVVNSSALVIDELGARWPVNNIDSGRTENSAIGELIGNANLATLGSFSGSGITFDTAPVRLGTIDFSADTIGATDVTFTLGANTTRDADGDVFDFVNGSRSVVVTNAIPEPASAVVLCVVAGIAGLRRRRLA